MFLFFSTKLNFSHIDHFWEITGISTGPLIGGVVAGIGLAIFIITFAYVRLHQLRQIPFNRQKDTIE